MFITTGIAFTVTIIVYHFISVVAGFCYMNEATQVQKHMLLKGSSDIINSNVNAMIQKYSLRTGVQPSLIKNCAETKKRENRYQAQRQQYLNKVNKVNKGYNSYLRKPTYNYKFNKY